MKQTAIEVIMDSIEWTAVHAPAPDDPSLPYVTHEGTLRIGDAELKAYRLSNGQRIFSEESVERFIGGGE